MYSGGRRQSLQSRDRDHLAAPALPTFDHSILASDACDCACALVTSSPPHPHPAGANTTSPHNNLADKLGDDKGIAEHLKLPIQRINDYQLLLKELVKYSRRLGDDCGDLQKALELFLGVPSRATDNKFLASIEGYRGNIYKLGRLLTHDWFTVTDNEGKTKDRYLFLFKARILVCKVKRVADDRSVFLLKDIIKLPETEVRDVPDSLKFEVLEKSGVHLRLSAHKQSVKEHWLTEIQRNLADVVALAEHAADDLQVVSPSQVTPEPPEENKKKRERQEETKAEATQIQEKRTKVEATEKLEAKVETVAQSISESKSEKTQQVTSSKVETSVSSEQKVQEKRKVEEISEQSVTVQEKRSKKEEIVAQETQKTSTVQETRRSSQKSEDSESKISTREESIRELIAKRKASLEIEAAQKLLKSEVTESSEVKTEVTSDLATKSAVTVKDSISTQAVTKTQETEIKSSTEQASSEQTLNSQSKTEQKSSVSASAEEKSAKVESGEEVKEEVTDSGQTATEGDDMSRYSRTSRLSGEYSSSSRRLSGNRVDSSAEGSGLTSSFSRRESGSRLESSSRFESSSALESGTTARYESKYSASSGIDAGSKYGIESSFESKTESSKYSVDDGSSKIDSIASKYGIGLNSDSALEGRSSKYAIESSYGSSNIGSSKLESSFEGKAESKYVVDSETTSKIDSIASKYGRKLSSNGTVESSKVESSYESVKNGGSSIESKYSKIANGSISTAGEAVQTLYKSASRDGRPVFSTTLEGQDIELTSEERQQRNALKMPYFEVALKDTEVMENTYLRFMVKVKGEPNPDVKFFRESTEITSSSERVSIIRRLADKGCYELVIADVQPSDAGLYRCTAGNIYGDCTTEARVTVVDDKNIFGELAPGGEGLLAKGEKASFSWKRDGEPFDPEERFKVLLGDDEDSLALVFQHVRPEDAGLYTCVAKTSTGNISCSAELTVQGAVHELRREPEKPSLVIEHRSAIVCAGASAMLELQCKGFPKPSVVFKHDGKVVEADTRHKFLYEDEESMSLVIKNVTTADAGTYHVTASNDLGEDTTTLDLVVTAAPKITKKIENQTCMMGATHTITIEIEGSPAPEVTFFKDGVEIKSCDRIQLIKESDTIYKIIMKDARLTDTGSYSIVAKNDINQCSDYWQWHVTSPPKVTKKLGESRVCEEKETVTFNIETQAEPAPTVTWFKNKTELTESSTVKISSSGESHTLVITSASRADAGEYSCEIRNVHGTSTDECSLKVRSAPLFTKRLQDLSAKEGDKKVELSVQVDAYPPPEVKWYHGDVEITEKKSVFTRVDSGDTHKLILKEVAAEMAGTFTCKVANDLGQDSCQATFTVHRKPRITKSLVDMTVEAGQTLKLEVEVEGCPDPKLTWYKDGKEVTTDARIKIDRDTQRLENYHLTVTLIKEEDGGEYEVHASNEMGSVSCKSTVTVHTLPTITSSNMKDGHVYESLPIVYSVSAAGRPAPKVRWLHNGKEVRQNARISISKEGDLHKLEIEAVDMDDGGKWQCELSNELGKKLQTAELSVTSVNEFRKPIFTQPLEAQRVMQREPVCLRAVCTADPLPHVTWLIDGKELTPDATAVVEESTKAIDHGLKECTYTLTIPTGRHSDTGTYTLQARNQYGFGESSARLDILLRPEIEGLRDVTAAPYEETTFVACVRANPIAEVQWSKDGIVIVPTSKHEVNSRPQDESYELVLKNLGLEDAGVYTLTAKNEIGETAQQAKLTIHTSAPVFTKPLQKQTVADYDSACLQVRCEGVPKPHVAWYRGDEEVSNDERRTISAECEGQMESRLDIQHFNASDAGKYKVRAVNLAGEATCEAVISLAKVAPGFAVRLEKQKDVDEGEPLELKAKVQGSPMPKLTWYKDGVELASNDPHIALSALPDGHVRLSIERAAPADCGAYKLVLSNPHGDSSMQCAVAVNPTPRKPSFSQELEDTKAVVGQPLKLQVTVMAFPAPEVKWFKDGLPIRASQAVSFTNQPGGVVGLLVDKCRPEDAGVYSVTLANKLGEAASKATVEVQARERKPAFLSELSPTKVIEGFPARLEVKLIGHPAPALKWFHNGKEIAPSDRIRLVSQPDGAHALVIDEARPEDAGTYSVQASNEKGEAACEAVLTVASRTDDSSPQERPQFGHGLRDVTADEGSRLALSAPFVGNPVPTPSWTKDDQPLKPNDRIVLSCDGTRLGLEINPVEPSDAGVYAVRIVNPLGEDKTQGAVTVKKVYQPPDFRQRFTDLQQLPTFDAKFPARVSGVPAPDVMWLKDGVPIKPGDKFHVKRDGDACCLYVRDVRSADAGAYTCVAKNREGEARCQARLEVVDNIDKRQKMEPPSFLKKIGDIEVLRGMSAKFTACVTGEPAPDIEWYRNDEKLFPCDRIRMDAESTGLLRLTIAGVDASDVAKYTCRATNAHGHAQCSAQLAYDSLEPQPNKRPLAEQYSDFDKMKKTGVCMPLADPPIISRMADRHLTLSWRPSIPHAARFPVTYQVEMCELPGGEWFTARAGLRTCVCDIRNLEPFRDYKFRIRVENKHGVSDPSPFAITHRCKLEPDPPRFVPYLAPGIDFRPDTSPYFPRDFDIERPPHDGYAQAPQFLRQEHECQYGVKGHNASLFWFVYGYPKPRISYYFEDQPIECGGRYDFSYTRNGQATLFINKMLERDEGYYEAVATNEHGTARQRVRLRVAEHPAFIQRPNESSVLQRRTARITARVTGVPAPDIKWYKDWQPLAASTRIKMQFVEPDTYVLVIQDCLLKDEGLYSISARNVAGSVSSSAMLHVHEDEEVYCSKMREHPPRVKPSSKPLGELYDLGDELGRGVQGVVYHAAERLTGRNYAVKIMHGNSDLKPFMKNELDIMNHLNSRGLVRLHAAFEQPHTLALVQELAGGGCLLRDRLLRGPGASEREIAGYVRQLLRALKDMHDSGVAHLGLTMGELLLSHSGSDELKLCDFGLSRRIQFQQHAALDYGTPEYVAPEVANGEGVSFGADLWSTGIITYILLSGISPFRGKNDRETLTKIREGKWEWHDEQYWSHFSQDCRDFISRLLVYSVHERLDVDAALRHPWMAYPDKAYNDEFLVSTDRLRNYYNLFKEWNRNAACHTWFRRRPLSGAFEHPSKMVYPPGLTYTPEATPERDTDSRERHPAAWDLKFKQWDHPDWEVSATSESHYQNGPDTYLLQLRDTGFPVRLREYMKVACRRHPGYSLAVRDAYDPRTPIIRERRRFTDVMDEEIDDEQRERIYNYGSDTAPAITRRLRHELGTRLDSYAEAEALMEAKRDGQPPFFREKPLPLAAREGEPACLSCLAVGDPKPSIQWFKNDMVIAEGQRIKILEDGQGRSTLQLQPAMRHDVGYYKVVARNKVGQTVARVRVVEATTPDAPDSPTTADTSDTEVLLRWKQPRHDGHAPVLCYSLQVKKGDALEWVDVAANIDHEFYVVKNLTPDTSYQFRLAARNKMGWSEKGIPTHLVKTKAAGSSKIQVTKAMAHLQQLTEAGREIVEEERPVLDYTTEESPIEWDTTTDLAERYSFISEVHRGRFCTVVKGVDKRTDAVVVAKVLEVRAETEVQVQREFEMLRRLRHSSIAGLLAAHQVPGAGCAVLVMERLQGADVLTYLSSLHSYSEQLVANIVLQILDGLQYLHWRGAAHLDLQPDNVVLAPGRAGVFKLVDLGSAHRVTRLGGSVPQVGDLEFKAPEIVNDEPAYPQTDVWSLGVLTYIMLSGVSPFRGDSPADTRLNISYVRYRFEHLYKELTQEATRFLMFIFKKVPLKRPTAEEAAEHRWLAQTDFITRKRERAVFLGHRIKEFSDEYHERKSQEASQADLSSKAFGAAAALRQLARSNSIQEELQTTFASQA